LGHFLSGHEKRLNLWTFDDFRTFRVEQPGPDFIKAAQDTPQLAEGMNAQM